MSETDLTCEEYKRRSGILDELWAYLEEDEQKRWAMLPPNIRRKLAVLYMRTLNPNRSTAWD